MLGDDSPWSAIFRPGGMTPRPQRLNSHATMQETLGPSGSSYTTS